MFIGIGLYYWTQSSTFRSKDWIFLIEVLFEVICVDHWHTVRQIKGKSSHAKWLMASVDFAKEMCKISKNISCAETACLLLRISLFIFLGVSEWQNFLASKNSCNEYFVEQTQISLAMRLLTWAVFSSFWNLFDLETAGLLWRIILQSFKTTELLQVYNTGDEDFLEQTQIKSNAESCNTTNTISLNFVSTGNLTSADRLTFTFCQLIRNAAGCVCWPTEFQKSQGVGCRWLFSMPSPLALSPIILAFARLYLLHYKP